MKKTKDSEIILKGFLWVNLPIIAIIFGMLLLLLTITDWRFGSCAIAATSCGWIYWEFSVVRWIRWALDAGVNQDRLFRLAQRSFLLWNRGKIDKAASGRE